MPDSTDDEMYELYSDTWWRNGSPDAHTAALRAIDRAAVRRTLDAVLSRLRAEPECDCQTRDDLIDYVLAMKEDL